MHDAVVKNPSDTYNKKERSRKMIRQESEDGAHLVALTKLGPLESVRWIFQTNTLRFHTVNAIAYLPAQGCLHTEWCKYIHGRSHHCVFYVINKRRNLSHKWADTFRGTIVTQVSPEEAWAGMRKDRAQQSQPFKSSGEVWIICSLMTIISHCTAVMCSTLTVWELAVAHLCLMRYSYRLKALIKHCSTITSFS